MQLHIALVRLNDGTQSVLRGHSDAVTVVFERGQREAGGGEILQRISREVRSAHEEDALWHDFIVQSTEPDNKRIAEETYAVWRRKAGAIWGYKLDECPGAVCFFMVGQDDMVLRVPDPIDS